MVFGRIIDISRRISNDATVYPGDPRLRVEPLCSIGPGCPCAMTRLGNWSTHVLTHLDAAAHFIRGGASLDQLPLERFVGEAVVIEVSGPSIRASDLGGALDVRGRSILFKTSNSAIATEAPFVASHVFVTKEAAERAVALGANMVGIDYLSVDRHGDHTYPAHYTLLGNNILILEGLDLSEAAPGRYQLSALPLKIAAADGSPVRAVLMAL